MKELKVPLRQRKKSLTASKQIYFPLGTVLLDM